MCFFDSISLRRRTQTRIGSWRFDATGPPVSKPPTRWCWESGCEESLLGCFKGRALSRRGRVTSDIGGDSLSWSLAVGVVVSAFLFWLFFCCWNERNLRSKTEDLLVSTRVHVGVSLPWWELGSSAARGQGGGLGASKEEEEQMSCPGPGHLG